MNCNHFHLFNILFLFPIFGRKTTANGSVCNGIIKVNKVNH